MLEEDDLTEEQRAAAKKKLQEIVAQLRKTQTTTPAVAAPMAQKAPAPPKAAVAPMAPMAPMTLRSHSSSGLTETLEQGPHLVRVARNPEGRATIVERLDESSAPAKVPHPPETVVVQGGEGLFEVRGGLAVVPGQSTPHVEVVEAPKAQIGRAHV